MAYDGVYTDFLGQQHGLGDNATIDERLDAAGGRLEDAREQFGERSPQYGQALNAWAALYDKWAFPDGHYGVIEF